MTSQARKAPQGDTTSTPAASNRELRWRFEEALTRLPGGDQINCCIQCGTCSGSCPVSWAMDYSPRQVIGLFRAGEIDTLLRSESIWICASCYQCAVRCPADIKITDLMYAFKRLAIDQRILPPKFNGYVFSETFAKQVRKYGRNYEPGLIGEYFLRTGLIETLRRSPSGWRLWSKGRMMLLPEKIKGIDTLRKIIDCAEQMEAVREPPPHPTSTDEVGYDAI